MRYPVILGALILALFTATLSTATVSAAEPPSLPEPWESVIPAVCDGHQNQPGSDRLQVNLASCDQYGVDLRVEQFDQYNEDPFPVELREAANWRRYNYGLCLIALYATDLGNFYTESEFILHHGSLCYGAGVEGGYGDRFGVDYSVGEYWAQNPIQATEIGDPYKCSVQHLCSQSGDTNPLNQKTADAEIATVTFAPPDAGSGGLADAAGRAALAGVAFIAALMLVGGSMGLGVSGFVLLRRRLRL